MGPRHSEPPVHAGSWFCPRCAFEHVARMAAHARLSGHHGAGFRPRFRLCWRFCLRRVAAPLRARCRPQDLNRSSTLTLLRPRRPLERWTPETIPKESPQWRRRHHLVLFLSCSLATRSADCALQFQQAFSRPGMPQRTSAVGSILPRRRRLQRALNESSRQLVELLLRPRRQVDRQLPDKARLLPLFRLDQNIKLLPGPIAAAGPSPVDAFSLPNESHFAKSRTVIRLLDAMKARFRLRRD